MKRFIQLHLLTSYPPANLNRDDLGRPKTAVMGGATRLRISSQSLKRAWRTSEIFEQSLKGHTGTRTKEMGKQIYNNLIKKQVSEKQAHEWAKAIAEQFGKPKKSDKENPLNDLDIEQLAHFSPEERAAIDELSSQLAKRGKGPNEDELELLRKEHSAADIALFGRMLASSPAFNVDAAAQVSHAITVHKVAVEDDYFTAVDDLNEGEEDVGAGHIGVTEFGAGLFYSYLCVNRSLLKDNISGSGDLWQEAIAALVETAAKVAPTGKQNSFASRAYASYILAEKGDQQPRSLSVAYLKPVVGEDMLTSAIKAIESTRKNMEDVYGSCADDISIMNAQTGHGSLDEIIRFAKTE